MGHLMRFKLSLRARSRNVQQSVNIRPRPFVSQSGLNLNVGSYLAIFSTFRSYAVAEDRDLLFPFLATSMEAI